jgi:hypothetical protein
MIPSPGENSGAAREIHILAHAVKPAAIECKFVGRKIDVQIVEAFAMSP